MDRTTLPPVEDDFMRALLRSAEGDEPSHAAYTKVASAVGASVGLGVTASLPPAVAGVSAGLSAVGRWSSSAAVRLATFGASSALLVAGGVMLLRSPSSDLQPKPSPAALPLRPHAAVSAPVPPLPLRPQHVASPSSVIGSRPTPGAVPSPHQAKRPPVPRAPRPVSESAQSSAGFSLAEQVQSLDRARVALSAGDSSGALREIAHYRAAWPSGVFVTEASVLEIEALAARGERSLAATRASAFVAAHPDSPQADRLRALIPHEKR